MVFNVLLTGVGGEGVMLTSVVVARAADIEGYQVRGIQLHGLAQRGGQIPTHVRFGKNVFSPTIPRGEADLILGMEPVEAARACYFADKKRAAFVIDTYPVIPVYTQILKERYPSTDEVKKIITPFAKKSIFVDASNICTEQYGDPIYGNVMVVGVAIGAGLLPLKQSSVEQSLKVSVPKLDINMKALRDGLAFGRKFR